MGKLVITDNTGVTTEYSLDKERVTIGRQASNDVVLNDKAVSGRHAAIVTILDDSFLEDLDSTNGTQVNGQPVTKHPLAHGDVVTVGRNTVRYFSSDLPEGDADKTMILRPGQLPTPAMAPPRAMTSPPPGLGGAAKPVLGRLRVSSGPNQGRELELSKALTTIGKPGVQVAAITRRADGYFIVQVDSSGGRKLRINGADVEATQPRRLAHRDNIELSGTHMEFMVVD